MKTANLVTELSVRELQGRRNGEINPGTSCPTTLVRFVPSSADLTEDVVRRVALRGTCSSGGLRVTAANYPACHFQEQEISAAAACSDSRKNAKGHGGDYFLVGI